MRRAPRGTQLALAAYALIAALVAFTAVEWWDFTVPSLPGARYQAVFLSNGQTYFGRYLDRLGPYVKLEDVYYIQQGAPSADDTPGNLRLVRRGVELHAPRSSMLIPKGTILFVEDLAPNSPFAQFMDRGGGQ